MTEQELNYFLKEAEKGDSNVQYMLGAEYLRRAFRGEDGDNIQFSYEWAKKSAEQNNPDGLCLLGTILEKCLDNHNLAIDYLEKAAKLNSVKACFNLHFVYIYEQNKVNEGIELLKKAVDKNPEKYSPYLETVNNISCLWEIVRTAFSNDEKIFLWNKSKVDKEKYISRIGIQTNDNDELLTLTETRGKTDHSEIATVHVLTKSQFYQGYRYYLRYKHDVIKLSDIKPKKCNKIITTLFHKLEEINSQYFELIYINEFD